MLSLITLLVTSVLATVATAQAPTTNFSSSTINTILGEEGLTLLNSWCTSQHSTCGTLCNGLTTANSCDGPTLNYTCTCTSNSSSPALQYYIGTIPFFICNRAQGDCLATNAGDSAAQQQCKLQYVCGNSTPNAAAIASAAMTSTSASATASPTGMSTASGSAATPSATKAAAIKFGQDYAVGIFAAGFLGVMGLFL
ncbi:hypothetical protein MMC19_004259 [Ptychographa xylographoides]|nr:hypothetical protein [Ptychographa xylographoides]